MLNASETYPVYVRALHSMPKQRMHSTAIAGIQVTKPTDDCGSTGQPVKIEDIFGIAE